MDRDGVWYENIALRYGAWGELGCLTRLAAGPPTHREHRAET